MDVNDFFQKVKKENEVIKEPEEKTKEPNAFFEFLNDIYYKKQGIFNDLTKKQYVPWSINKFVSGNIDTVPYAQEMNQRYFLDKEMQHDYYFYGIRKRKRYSKWVKSKRDELVELLMEYYNYSREKARQVLDLHTSKDLEYIKRRLDKGGQEKRKK